MNLENIFSWLKNHKIFVLILFLGCIPLIWFKNNLFLIFGDVVFPIHELELSDLIVEFYAWKERSYAGLFNLYTAKMVPLLSFWTFFRKLGFSFLAVEKLWFILVFILPGMSMCYLTSVVVSKGNNTPKLIASIFYMFNPFVLVHSTTMQWGTLLVYGLSPLILGLFIKGSKTQECYKYALLIGLSSLLFASAGINLVTYSVAWMPVFLYIFYDILQRRNVRIFIFTGKVFMATFLINLFWIIPYFVYFYDPSQYFTTIESVNLLDHLKWSSQYSTLENLFRLLGKWGWWRTSNESFYYPYHTVYDNPIFVSTLFIPIILIGFVALSKSRIKETLFFFCLLVIGLFLAKGSNSPIGNVYVFLFNKMPGFWGFRESFPRFMPMVILSYSVLLGVAAQMVTKRTSRTPANHWVMQNIHRFFIFGLIGVVLFNAWPLLTGDVVPQRKGKLPGSETKIPDYWFEMSDYINDGLDISTRIFVLPENLPYQKYTWKNYPFYGQDLTPYLIKNPLISLNSGGGYTRPPHTLILMEYIYSSVGKRDTDSLASVLSLLGIQYILQRNDLDWTHFGTRDLGSPDYIREIFAKEKNINFTKSFGELDLYKISDKYFLPHIYASPDKIGL